MRLPWHQPRSPVARPMPAFPVPVLHPQVRFDIAPVARRLQQRNIHEYQPVDAVVEVGIDAKIDELQRRRVRKVRNTVWREGLLECHAGLRPSQ